MKFIVTGGSGFIGTNLIRHLTQAHPSSSILNLDISPPRDASQTCYYSFCDVNEYENLLKFFVSFCPTHVFHLAATTGIENYPLDYFCTNTLGVSNVVKASSAVQYLSRIIFASSLLVCRVGYIPDSFDEYCPSTSYGISKMKGELIVKNALESIPWVIVRPISIWGPWNSEPYTQFFKAVLRGSYFHIGRILSMRSLGYVGNTVYQLEKLALAESSLVVNETFYLADYEPASLRMMANAIARYRRGLHIIPTLPLFIVKILSLVGDLLQCTAGVRAPLNSFRLNNLLTEYVFNLSALERICGPLPFDVKSGIAQTISWLKCLPGRSPS
jgi:nucleoside-diphosphate-sugar epimerase